MSRTQWPSVRLTLALVGALALAVTLKAGPAHAGAPTCFGKTATKVGTSGNDTLRGTPRPDVIVGLRGDDTIKGLRGNDRICGGAGYDSDSIGGGLGADRINGGVGPNVMGGSYGNDVLLGRGSKSGGPGADTLSSETACGLYDGGPGNDVFRCEGDNCFGQITYEHSPGPVDVNLTTGSATGYGTDTIDPQSAGNFCYVTGSNFGDTIVGTISTEYLYGLGGNDTLDGLTGNPAAETGLLDGGDGFDVCRNSDGTDIKSNCEAGS